MLEKGADKETIIKAADYYISHIHHVFTVRTLNYLIKGGRLSKVSGTIGETLDIKPILIVDRDGKLSVLQKVRGSKKAFKTLVEYVKENAHNPSNQVIAVCHGEDQDSLALVKKYLDEQVAPKEYFVSTVGCAIGAHTGRGIIGICFFDADDGEFAEYFADYNPAAK